MTKCITAFPLNKMGKRKLKEDEKGVKRHKFSEEELWSESDDEQLMCDAAEEIEIKKNLRMNGVTATMTN